MHELTKKAPHALAASIISLTASWAMAAGSPAPAYNASDAAKDATNAAPPPAANPQAAPVPDIRIQEEMPLGLVDAQTLAITDFTIEGADFLSDEERQTLLQPYRGRSLSMAEINAVANRITVASRQKGYLVAKAYIPKQEVKQGVLLIKVVPGHYGNFTIQNQSRVNEALIRGAFDAAKRTSATITREGLERAMLLVNDMPGASMPRIGIAPGQESGTTDINVEVTPAERIKGYLSADNFGSAFTGKTRIAAGVDINAPFGPADRLSLSGMTSDRSGLLNGRVAYSLWLSPQGLKAELAASRTTYQLGDQYADINGTGSADSVNASLAYPLQRSRDASLYLSLDLASKYLRDDTGVDNKTVAKRSQVGTLSLRRETTGRVFGFDGNTTLIAGLSFGHLKFDDPVEQASDRAKANTAGHFSKVSINLSGNFALNPRWTLSPSLIAQHSLDKNLDGSEQLSISGPGGIRNYADGATGDNGYLLGSELKYALPSVADLNHSLGGFVEYGEVRPQHPATSTTGRVAISDVGLSYGFWRKAYFGRIQLAQNTGNSAVTQSHNNDLKIKAQIGMRF